MDSSFVVLPVAVCVGLNILVFAVFACDKRKAKANVWRIPENTLLLLAIPGPFGALFAMIVVRHKTRHAKFIFVPIFALLHLLLAVRLWYLIHE